MIATSQDLTGLVSTTSSLQPAHGFCDVANLPDAPGRTPPMSATHPGPPPLAVPGPQ